MVLSVKGKGTDATDMDPGGVYAVLGVLDRDDGGVWVPNMSFLHSILISGGFGAVLGGTPCNIAVVGQDSSAQQCAHLLWKPD